jgi:hypothetical protein
MEHAVKQYRELTLTHTHTRSNEMRNYQFVENRDAVRKIKRGVLIDISPNKHTTNYLLVPRVKTVLTSIYNSKATITFGKSWSLTMDLNVYEQHEDDLLAAAIGEEI